jgi:hypothetical protein
MGEFWLRKPDLSRSSNSATGFPVLRTQARPLSALDALSRP